MSAQQRSGMDDGRAARVVRQHARTLQALGVESMLVRGVVRGGASARGDAQAGEAKRVARVEVVSEAKALPPASTVAARAAQGASVLAAEVSGSPRVERGARGVAAASAEGAEMAKKVPAAEVVTAASFAGDERRMEAQGLLDEIRARYERDAPHEKFVTDHHSIVFGDGDPCARLMFVGEAPGAEEDKVGRPFVGRAGQLLDKMIVAMGLERKDVYIANVLKTRPPNNATPTSDECALCAPYLFEQIAAVSPEVIVTLGLPATRVLLNTQASMGSLRGQWASFKTPTIKAHGTSAGRESKLIPVMPTYHPAFLLRAYTTENRQKVWSDLKQAAKRLGLKVGTPAE